MSNTHKLLNLTKLTGRSFTTKSNYSKNKVEAQSINRIHVSSSMSLPQAAPIRLPQNMQDINSSEMGQFSPHRARDINGPVIISHRVQNEQVDFPTIDITINSDPHVASYDCRGAVSLSSTMQSNVPSPFSGNRSHLGMPGSQWCQAEKYLSQHLQSSHYLNLRNMYRKYHSQENVRGIHTFPFKTSLSVSGTSATNLSKFHNKSSLFVVYMQSRNITDHTKTLTMKEKLKKAVTEYGTTVIVFHISISLVSLGVCYMLVSSGLDLVKALEYLHLADETMVKRLSNAGTFVVAYGVHKVFAPARIGTTLVVAPLLVTYLRKKGILKT